MPKKITKIPRIDVRKFFEALSNNNRWDEVPIDNNFQILVVDVGNWYINPVQKILEEGIINQQYLVLKLGVDEFSKLVAGVLNIDKEIEAGTCKVHPPKHEGYKYIEDLLGV
jgi:hypothetical protein